MIKEFSKYAKKFGNQKKILLDTPEHLGILKKFKKNKIYFVSLFSLIFIYYKEKLNTSNLSFEFSFK